MAALTTLTQARALARRVSKGFGQLSGFLDFFGFGFLADVLQAFAVAALLVAFLLTLLMRQLMTLTSRLVRALRVLVLRVVGGGGFFLVCTALSLAFLQSPNSCDIAWVKSKEYQHGTNFRFIEEF